MKNNLLKRAILLKTLKKAFCQAGLLLLFVGLSFTVLGATGLPLKEEPKAYPPVVVRGLVTDDKLAPLPGVGIKIKGTTEGTVTDKNGRYQITAPNENTVLVFSFVGLKPQEQKVGIHNEINVVMQPDERSLNEIVVVGYATQKKADLSGAVSTVSGKTLNERIVSNPVSLLQGRAPGLAIIQNSGEPGNNGIVARIRGLSTFSANADPLVVVDGIPLPGINNLNQLNANDIDNVSVLKDAASASIYGTRAANGVILVTTKKGSSNGKFNLDYSYDGGITSATRLLKLVTNSVQYMTLANQVIATNRNGGVLRAPYSDDFIAQYQPGGKYANVNVDWQDLIFSTVLTSNHYLSANGTTNNLKYNISLGYINEPGILTGIHNKKYTFQLGLNAAINKTIDLGVNVNMNFNDNRQEAQGSTDSYISSVTQPPFWGPYTFDGSGHFTDTNGSDPTGTFHNKNIFAVNQYAPAIYKQYNGILNMFVNVKVLKGLVWETRGAANFQYGYNNNFRPQVKTYNYFTGLPGADLDVGRKGLTVWETTNINPIFYSQLHYTKSIGDNNFSFLGGAQYEYNYSDFLQGFRNGFLPYVSSLRQLQGSGVTPQDDGTSNANETALESLYGRFNYNYKEKYLIEANARYDGSSRFASGNKWALFPSFSAAWRVTQEQFIKNLNLTWLSEFKLRGSWGRLGNQNIGTYPYQAVLNTGNSYALGNAATGTTAVQYTNLVDNTIRWETSEQTDLGLQIGFLNGRLNFEADWYNRKNYDLLRGAVISAYKGLAAPTVNYGIMTNKGWEFSASYNDRKGDFSYGVVANLDLNRNKLVKFGAPQIGGNTRNIEGLEYNGFYLYQFTGIFQSQAQIDASPKQSFNPQVGDPMFKDVDHNGVIDSRDITYVKGENPNFNYSFNFNFGYKQFDLTVYLYGSQGRKNLIYGFGYEPFVQGEPPLQSYVNSAWTPQNHSNTTPALYSFGYQPVDGYLNSTLFLKDASFLRVKTIQLGYNFPTDICKKIGMTNLKLYVAGDNLFLFAKYPELDPEITGNTGTFVFDGYPQNRVIEIGAKVKF